MLKKLILILLAITIITSITLVPMLALAESVEDRLTEDQIEATPIIDENGNEIAFEVKGKGASNSGGAIFIMVAVVLVGVWLIADGLRSFIRRSRKESKERFNKHYE